MGVTILQNRTTASGASLLIDLRIFPDLSTWPSFDILDLLAGIPVDATACETRVLEEVTR